MNHCLLKEQYILLLKFLLVSLSFFQIKKNIKKKKYILKQMTYHQKNEIKKFSELKNLRTQSMSLSENVSVR